MATTAYCPTPYGSETLTTGMQNSAVVELQMRLAALGYGLGPDGIDGDYGPDTGSAVSSFQTNHGIPATGVADTSTQFSIGHTYAIWGTTELSQAADSGTYNDAVVELQVRLAQWGFYTGSIDGIFGSGTNAAVENFQKYVGITQDGIVGEETYTLLINHFDHDSEGTPISGYCAFYSQMRGVYFAIQNFTSTTANPPISPITLFALIEDESDWNPCTTSNCNCGLMQFCAVDAEDWCGSQYSSGENLATPENNLLLGECIWNALIGHYDVPRCVQDQISSWNETGAPTTDDSAYVARVRNRMIYYGKIKASKSDLVPYPGCGEYTGCACY